MTYSGNSLKTSPLFSTLKNIFLFSATDPISLVTYYFSISNYSTQSLFNPMNLLKKGIVFLWFLPIWTAAASLINLSAWQKATIVGEFLPDDSFKTVSIPPPLTAQTVVYQDPISIPIAPSFSINFRKFNNHFNNKCF